MTDSDLIKIIKNEQISITDKILYFNKYGETEDRNYYLYWNIKGNKTIWREGAILLRDDNPVLNFMEAIEDKYKIRINRSEYKEQIEQKINKYKSIYE